MPVVYIHKMFTMKIHWFIKQQTIHCILIIEQIQQNEATWEYIAVNMYAASL